MKTSVINTSDVLESFMKKEVAKHKFCFVIYHPGEQMIWKEVNAIVGENLEPKNDTDNRIVVIAAKDMGEMKSLWGKILSKEIQAYAIAYKDGVQFTW